MSESPWKTLSTKEIYDNPWIHVNEHEVINPRGGKGIYGKVHFKNQALGIVPLDEEWNTWLVGQHRYPIDVFTWEIPEGGGHLHASPLESAQRELQEETGIVANRWQLVQEMWLSNSVTDEHAWIFVAQDLRFTLPNPDETEVLTLKKLSFQEAFNRMLAGEITDSLSVAALFRVHHMMATGQLTR